MRLFKRKESKEEIDEEKFRDGKEKKKQKRKVRKKKEKSKPWGKKERVLILIILSSTVITSGILALSSRGWKLPGFPRLTFPTFNLFKSETIVIEKNEVSSFDKESQETITDNFKNSTKDLSGVYSFYIINLDSGHRFGEGEEETFQAASLIKLPVMAAMFMEEERGQIDLETMYTLKSDDKVAGSGSLFSKPEGTKLTYLEIIKLMGKESDNTAFKIARNTLGDEKIEDAARRLGMNKTSLSENNTLPEDVGSFFKKVWESKFISKINSGKLLSFLTDTVYESWIPEGIPDEVAVAHKFGKEVNVVNDAGIIFAQKPYILVIMSKGVVESEADKVIPQISEMVYSQMSR